jgi:hypothetical protein
MTNPTTTPTSSSIGRVIRGSKPRTFPVGAEQSHDSLMTVYGQHYEGKEQVVPEGQVLVVPEHGKAPDSGQQIRHQFSAGTRFVVRTAGDAHTLSVTEILEK